MVSMWMHQVQNAAASLCNRQPYHSHCFDIPVWFFFFIIMTGRLEEKSIKDICHWLEEKGFSEQLIESFRGK